MADYRGTRKTRRLGPEVYFEHTNSWFLNLFYLYFNMIEIFRLVHAFCTPSAGTGERAGVAAAYLACGRATAKQKNPATLPVGAPASPVA